MGRFGNFMMGMVLLAMGSGPGPGLGAAGFEFKGPGTPTPRPPNPHNNPWLNYPTHYGPGVVQQHDDGLPAEAMARLDRFMALGEGERKVFAFQAEQAALKRGEALFNDARLGSTGLNCAACHPSGGSAGGKVGMGRHEVAIPSLLNVAQRYPRYKPLDGQVITQTDMQNNCIRMFLKGQPLAAGSREAADLALYVGRFSP